MSYTDRESIGMQVSREWDVWSRSCPVEAYAVTAIGVILFIASIPLFIAIVGLSTAVDRVAKCFKHS